MSCAPIADIAGGKFAILSGKGMDREMNMLPELRLSVDEPLLTAAFSDVASKWLPVLHIPLILPEN
jgi:hypothetical protein